MKSDKYYGSILKTLLVLAFPAIMEQLLSTLLQYVDTAMVGKLGENATAAVSVTTTISWLAGSLISAFSVPIVAMIAKQIGEKNEQKVKNIAKQVVLVVIGAGAFVGGLCMILSPWIPVWMGAEKAIQKDASIYFFIISIPYVFRTASWLFAAALRATKDTKSPMLISTFSNVLNIVFNFVFIYALDLGVMGAAIASAISYTIGGSLMFIRFKKNPLLHFDFICDRKRGADQQKWYHIDREIMKTGWEQCFPVLLTNLVSCLGYVFFARIVSGMGTTIFAAHSIAVTAETCFYIPGYGVRTATSTLVGISYGEKDQKKFESICIISIGVTIVMMIVTGFCLYEVSYPLMCLFTSSDKVAVLGAKMLRLVAFSEPFFGLMVIAEGIMYGLGKTRYAFWAESISMWGLRIVLAFLCVNIWKQGLSQVWYCMILDNICKAVLLGIPVISKKGRHKLYGQARKR